MRRLALFAVAALAACSVKLEGAPCNDDANCPSGQACGYDRTCSEAATGCLVNECRQGDASCPSQSVATVCLAQGVCGSWQTTNCGAPQICGAGGCQARYQLQITSPGAGVTLGASGVSVEVSLTPGPTVSPPAQLTLVATSTATTTSTLSRTTAPSVTPALYQGTYVPLPNLEEQVTLQAFAAYGLGDQTGSNQVVVAVDTRPPQVTGVTLSCGTCRRDDILTVHAAVTDAHLSTVTATIEFPPGWSQPVTLMPPTSGSDWQGTLALAGQAFPFYQASGRASVTATDSLGNQRTDYSPNLTVTRLRFALPVEATSPPAITGPAVGPNGTLYLGAANGKVYVVDPAAPSVTGWNVALGAIVAPPSLGAALWVGSQDGVIYAVNPASGLPIGSCATSGQVVATPAIDTASPETAYAGAVIASSNGRVFAVRSSTGCVASTNIYTSQKVAASPAIDAQRRVYAVTGSNLRSLTLVESPPPPAFSENWSAPVGPVEAPVGLDPGRAPGGFVWTGATDGSIAATAFGGTPLTGSPFATSAGPDAPVIDAAGNVVVGDAAGFVRKVVPGGTGWTTSSSLGGAVLSMLVLANGDAAYLAPTATGKLAALKDDGTLLWSGQVAAAGSSLHEPNILQLPGDTFWTAVFGAQDGTVYGVLVDGHLDAAAPWPKAHHDARNTGNVVTPLP
jgi:hypothetical protein